MEAVGLSLAGNGSYRELLDTFLKQKCRRKGDFMADAPRVDRLGGIDLSVKLEETENEEKLMTDRESGNEIKNGVVDFFSEKAVRGLGFEFRPSPGDGAPSVASLGEGLRLGSRKLRTKKKGPPPPPPRALTFRYCLPTREAIVQLWKTGCHLFVRRSLPIRMKGSPRAS